MEQLDLLRLAAETLDRIGVRYAFSFASGVWGEPRMTHDIDVVAELDPAAVKPLSETFAEPDFYLSQAAAFEPIRGCGQFNVLHPASGNKIDFVIADQSDWAQSELARARRLAVLPGTMISVASPEDVILGKLAYYREGASDKHLRDIASILSTAVSKIDYDYLKRYAERIGVDTEWREVLGRLDRREGRTEETQRAQRVTTTQVFARLIAATAKRRQRASSICLGQSINH